MKKIFLVIVIFSFPVFSYCQQQLILLDQDGIFQFMVCDLQGNSIEVFNSSELGLGPINSFAIDKATNNVYVTSRFGTSSLAYFNLSNPDEVNILFDELTRPYGLHIDQTNEKLYWIEYFYPVEVKLKRANLDGSEVEELVNNLNDYAALNLSQVDFSFVSQENALFTVGTLDASIQKIDIQTYEIDNIYDGVYDLIGIVNWESENKLIFAEDRSSSLHIFSCDYDGSDLDELFAITSFVDINYWTSQIKHFEFDEENEMFYFVGTALNDEIFSVDINGTIIQNDICPVDVQGATHPDFIYVSLFEYQVTKLDAPLFSSSMNIYPNPSDGTVFITIPDEVINLSNEINVFNSFGQKIISKKIISTNCKLQLNEYPAGIYFLQVELGNGEMLNDKLIIQK